jgi:hypothetical protein
VQEAGAYHAIQSLVDVQVGKTFIVCDIGGYKAEVRSYNVTKLKPSLQLRESVPGKVSLIGSKSPECRFKDFLTSKLGKEKGWDDVALQLDMEQFELVADLTLLI